MLITPLLTVDALDFSRIFKKVDEVLERKLFCCETTLECKD